MPFPYRHANGEICCSSPDACCESCKAKRAAEARAAAHAAIPPDPYAAPIAALRAADACPCIRFCGEISPDLDPHYDDGVAPDGYSIHLALRQLAAEPRDVQPLSAAERAMLGLYADGVAAMRGATK